MAEPPPLLNTYAALVTTFTSLLTVSIHTILYERSIYPRTTFLSTRKYNYPVRQSRHPKVCAWINDAVAAVEEELLKGIVARVALVIYSPAALPLERFLFDVSGLPEVPAAEALTEFESEGATQVNTVDLEEQFRDVMRKLTFCGAGLGELPAGCTFTISIELKSEAEPPIGVGHDS
jgi:mitotic spindle assembly checkpoint protein MAD2B